MQSYKEALPIIRRELKFLSKWHLELDSESVDHSEFFGDRLFLQYVSKKTGMSILIFFSEKQKNEPQNFSISIYSGEGEHFFLNEYLEDNGKDEVVKSFANENNEVLSEFVVQFSNTLKNVFENILSDILSGKSWDIESFDWSPYRL